MKRLLAVVGLSLALTACFSSYAATNSSEWVSPAEKAVSAEIIDDCFGDGYFRAKDNLGDEVARLVHKGVSLNWHTKHLTPEEVVDYDKWRTAYAWGVQDAGQAAICEEILQEHQAYKPSTWDHIEFINK